MANFESKLGSIMTYVDGIPFIKMKDALDLTREADAALAAKDAEIETLTQGFEGHDEPCYYCGEKCSSLSGNPGLWPVGGSHPDDPGVLKFHHAACTFERADGAVKEITRLTALNTAKGELINLFETHFDTLNLWHQYQDDFKAVRARIRSLENE
jgi:hypothetical protein